MKAKSIFALVLAMVLLAVLVSPTLVSADTSQRWYLSNYNHPVGNGTKVMKLDASAVGWYSVTLEPHKSKIWLANESVENDMAFAAGNWTLNITTESTYEAHTVVVEVGSYNATTKVFTPVNSTTITYPIHSTRLVANISADPVIIKAGAYLALRITIACDHNIYVKTCGKSWLEPPAYSPNYPVPEIPTVALFGIGLAGLVGYLAVRDARLRRRAGSLLRFR